MTKPIALESFKKLNLNQIQYTSDNDKIEVHEAPETSLQKPEEESEVIGTIRQIKDDNLYIGETEIRKAPGILKYINKNDYVELIDDQSYQLMGYTNNDFQDKEREDRSIKSETSLHYSNLETYTLNNNIPFNTFNIETQNKIGVELMKSTELIFEWRGMYYLKSSRMTYFLENSFIHNSEDTNDDYQTDNGMLDYWYDLMIKSNDAHYINMEQTDYNDIPFINVPLIIIPPEHFNNYVRFYLSLYQMKSNIIIPRTDNLYDSNHKSIQLKETDPKTFFITSFRRFLLIRRDSIPFGGGFGNSLRDYLQTKVSTLKVQIIFEEVYEYMTQFNIMYNVNYELIDINFEYINNGLYMKLVINVIVKINSKDISIGIMGPSFESS